MCHKLGPTLDSVIFNQKQTKTNQTRTTYLHENKTESGATMVHYGHNPHFYVYFLFEKRFNADFVIKTISEYSEWLFVNRASHYSRR